MSTGSTLRRARERVTGGSIKKQKPNSYRNHLWLIEKAKRECEKRQAKLDDAMAVMAYYWTTFMQKYPEDAKAILEAEQEMLKAKQESQQPEPTKEVVIPEP